MHRWNKTAKHGIRKAPASPALAGLTWKGRNAFGQPV